MWAGISVMRGSREAGLNASRGQEQAAHFLDELRLRLRRAAGCLLLQGRPEAIADFEHKLRAAVSGHAADGACLQFLQVHGDLCWRSCHRSREFIQRCTQATGLAIGHQAGVDVEFEGAIGEDRDGPHKFSTRGEPSGGLFEDQPGGAHARPPAEFDAAFLFFLRIDSPFISMR